MARLSQLIERSFEGLIRVGVGCFLFIVVSILVIGFLNSYQKPKSLYHPSVAGPRVPIPTVSPATLAAGSSLYQTEGCSGCHGGIGEFSGSTADPSIPDLTHEGRRNADIGWQMRNLRQHSRLSPGGSMGD
jgi:mono/diheme cytochrome c family protein